MKTSIKQVLLQTSLFIVQFCTRYLKIPSWIFFIKNQPTTDAFEAFVKTLSRVLSTSNINSNLTKVIAAIFLTNFTFALYRISEQKFLMILCYTELLFPIRCESDRTLLSSRLTTQSVQENILKKFLGNISQECNCSDSKSK